MEPPPPRAVPVMQPQAPTHKPSPQDEEADDEGGLNVLMESEKSISSFSTSSSRSDRGQEKVVCTSAICDEARNLLKRWTLREHLRTRPPSHVTSFGTCCRYSYTTTTY